VRSVPRGTATWVRSGSSALTHGQAGAVVLRCARDAVDRTDLTGSALYRVQRRTRWTGSRVTRSACGAHAVEAGLDRTPRAPLGHRWRRHDQRRRRNRRCTSEEHQPAHHQHHQLPNDSPDPAELNPTGRAARFRGLFSLPCPHPRAGSLSSPRPPATVFDDGGG
jgi:hypothetical protein